MIKEVKPEIETQMEVKELPIGSVAYISIGDLIYLVYVIQTFDTVKQKLRKGMVSLDDATAFWSNIAENTAKVIKMLPKGSKLEVC